MEALQSQGITVVSVDDAIEKIAQDNATSPMELYRIIKHLEKAGDDTGEAGFTAEMIEERFAGTGIGRKTLAQVCEQLGLDCSIARKRLGQKGMEIGEGEKIKDSAERYDMNPLDILKLIVEE